jgi:hypothetical protein
MPEGEQNAPQNAALQREYRAIDADYRRDVAIVEARPLLWRVGLALWSLLDIVLIGFFVIVVVGYLISGAFEDARSMAGLANNVGTFHAITEAQQPSALQPGTSGVLGTGGKYDLFALLSNDNESWSVTFTYFFKYDGGETERQTGFLNPKETRSLTTLAVASSGSPRNPRIVLEDIAWMRVDRHAVPNITQWLDNHNTFSVSRVVYSNNIGLNGAKIGQSDFILSNKTAYGYWEPKFLVFLERGKTPLAVTEITVPRFISGESRQINVRWTDAIPASATVRIVPVINYADDSLYMKPAK